LALVCNSFNFSTLTDKERQLIEDIVVGRMDLGKPGLEVMRTLERILTIPSDIIAMSDEIFHRHLVLTSQMTFNVRKNKLLFLFCFGLMITSFNIYP
jgi:hypothetical protein